MQQIQDLAGVSPQELLDQLGINEPPYDPFAIAQQLGVTVTDTVDFDQINNSGTIRAKNGKVYMWVNPLEAQYRRRFTAAHELGHLIHDILPELKSHPDLDGFTDISHARGIHRDPKERRADEFAAKLLMPGSDVLEKAKAYIAIQKQSDPDKKVERENLVLNLAEFFGVSRQAMDIRLKNLGIR
jgi:Zn-dependent peptidase ImmA (M78 family)